MTNSPDALRRSLTPLMVWGLGVGYVISGNYFGWNLGLERGGTLGFAVAIFFIVILYITFTLSYTELACAVPKAGGAFDYARRAMGGDIGFMAGMAQNIEFIFAPPAIAFAIGSYFNLFFPWLPPIVVAVLAYFIFVSINIYGVKVAATFELIVTLLAVAALIFFAGITSLHFQWINLAKNSLPNGWAGSFAAVPFAIWFFLGIEGVANLAEEAINPRRTIMIGFGSAIATLVVLCVLTFSTSVGVAGWEAVVYNENGSTSDSPLPLAMGLIVNRAHIEYKLLLMVGLFGLVASFHGLMLAAGRSTFEFGRVKYAPDFLGRINPRFQTPANALLINMVLGIVALFTGKTSEIITISVMGALTLYIISMVAVILLRKKEPGLPRPFHVPAFPVFPVTAMVIATVALLAVVFYNLQLAMIYGVVMVGSFALFKIRNRFRPAGVGEE